ncbi:SUKH-3 domain-containing protein [Phaeacidiphilus oryzae]|uniref:SUKH-3 domain-containing protein n=1 Tax=Phaeacidiphilus oryzae TaxID=348818 RepID=UPI0005678DBF|nr:SUKH-3 domain-containing protein [Phaeacidiphilus oryzae]
MQPRFPDEVVAALQRAGWHPGRRQQEQAEEWARVLLAHLSPEGHRHVVFPAAADAWAEFGGLQVDLEGLDEAGHQLARTPFTVDPLLGLHQPRTLADLGRALEVPVAALGAELDGRALLAIDALGRVYSLDHTGEWYLGESVDAAITTLVTGALPRRLNVG